MKRSTVVGALGLQILSVGVSILLGVTGIPFAALSVLTVIILLKGLRNQPETKSSIEELVEVKVSERTSALVAQMSEYEQQASTDALTGLLNRRGGEASVANHILRSNSLANPLSFLLLDIDHFKIVNDSYGHAVGDAVITSVAICLKSNIRASDVAIRWGGEEYLIILPNTDLQGAINTAEKLREQVTHVEVRHATVSVSIGCAELGQDDFSVVLARADMNLYFAKTKGRNRVFPDFDRNTLDR